MAALLLPPSVEGRADVPQTHDVYSGLFDDDLGALAERMDATRDALKTSRSVGIVGR
jgi:hypothetical protein